MRDDLIYFQIGGVLGAIPAIVAFVGGWWYCAATYGFLFGFGLGWLPAGILAALVELAVMLLWGPALAATAYFALSDGRAPVDTQAASLTASAVTNIYDSIQTELAPPKAREMYGYSYGSESPASEPSENPSPQKRHRVRMDNGETYEIFGPRDSTEVEAHAEVERQMSFDEPDSESR